MMAVIIYCLFCAFTKDFGPSSYMHILIYKLKPKFLLMHLHGNLGPILESW